MKGSIDIDIDIKIFVSETEAESESESETTGRRLKAQKDSMKETQQTPTVVYTPPKQEAKKKGKNQLAHSHHRPVD